MSDTKIIYRIPAPYSMTVIDSQIAIEVYGDPDMAWYEWRITMPGQADIDTGKEQQHGTQGRQYGSPEIALRDALCVLTDLPDPYLEDMKQYDSPEP